MISATFLTLRRGREHNSLFPEFSTPQAPLALRECTKERSRTQTLAPGHHLGAGIPEREGTKAMDMLRTHLHLLNGTIIWLGNISKVLLDPPLHRALHHVAAVLGRPDHVVEGIVDGRWCSSEDHATMVLPQTVFDSGH
jgi:hypothetical protein